MDLFVELVKVTYILNTENWRIKWHRSKIYGYKVLEYVKYKQHTGVTVENLITKTYACPCLL